MSIPAIGAISGVTGTGYLDGVAPSATASAPGSDAAFGAATAQTTTPATADPRIGLRGGWNDAAEAISNSPPDDPLSRNLRMVF